MTATPILDFLQDPPLPQRAWKATLIGSLFGAAFALAIIWVENLFAENAWCPGFNGLLFVPAFYVATAIHEVGHYLAGKSLGLASGGFAVGAFIFTKSGDNWIFRFDRRLWIGGFFVPLVTPADVRVSAYAWMVAGGPIASILGAIAVWFLCQLQGSGEWNWLGTVFWACVFSMISLVPASSGLTKSDGSRLWGLFRHPKREQAWIALIAVHSQETKGVRPRDWDAESTEKIAAIDENAREFSHCHWLLYYRALDQGREEEALQHLEQALGNSSRSGKVIRQSLFLEAAWSSAHFRNDANRARQWLTRAIAIRKPESMEAVHAAISMSEGRHGDAERQWQAAIQWVESRRFDSGLVRFAKERWAFYADQCRRASSAPGEPAITQIEAPA